MAEAALVVLAALLLACVLEPWLSTYRYDRADLALGPTPPSWAHWMGTDQHGRDLMARIFFGGRVSLAVGLVATGASLVIGVTWGAVAGWVGGRVDAVMMRVVDGLYAFPLLVLVIVVMVFFGGERTAPFRAYRAALAVLVVHPDDPAWLPLFQMVLVTVVLGAVCWLTMARIVRALVLSLREQPFVEAARALGAGHAAILLRHVLPNALGPIVVYAALTVPEVMMAEAFLSFLGPGVQEPLCSWASSPARAPG